MGGTDRVCSMPYRVISALLACIIVAFGIALAAGMLEVRRPVKTYRRRLLQRLGVAGRSNARVDEADRLSTTASEPVRDRQA